ncbi:hypothetical protein [Methanococcoides sp. LMO-2]|uniref:Uncharacterized protein n=1 Tax=Methanococcoides cohabitans TaxID=3136559 RepID=A0ABU9KPN8_9EURY
MDVLTNQQEKITHYLITEGKFFWDNDEIDNFTNDPEADKLVKNIYDFPHAFVLAAVMDRGIDAERAWAIPYEISIKIGNFDFSNLRNLSLMDIEKLFNDNKLHRYNNKMADCFFSAVQKIDTDYEGDASKIWDANPKSAIVVRRFLEFKGIGVKIATMATNMLARDFKIPMADCNGIDISPDVQTKRVFKRIGLIRKNSSDEELLYSARAIYP